MLKDTERVSEFLL
ncbi:hypothetical protein Bhyg_03000 [Pseudolycoriella hygida]|uniref:Uncharacterized protein n=1 Tax=Pseudolycoriella hygida TaxID=35572 RepID=A0A9Q0NCH1_9DIPT|nr:hypothetical protein Bhyg_03000 [Pseudolycoriella hygida]